jgi:predicted NAD/FAD-binding protein
LTETLAVIGSGIAGLAAARLARNAGYAVTLFEAAPQRGMDAHRIAFAGGQVDVPLRVMNPEAWRTVLALARSVGIDTFEVDTWVACSWLDGPTWLRTTRMPLTGWPSVARLRDITPRNVRVGLGLIQLARQLNAPPPANLTLGEWLQEHPQDPLFWRGLVLPLLTTICTCREPHLLAWPAAPLLSLLNTIVHGERLRRLTGGTAALADALSRDIPLRTGTRITHLTQAGDEVVLHTDGSEPQRFDRVIVATPAPVTQFLDPQQFGRELAALQAIRFDAGELWVHTDTRFLPPRQADQTALHYQVRRDLSEAMFTVLVNRVEPALASATPVMQTWNPLMPPASGHVLARVPLSRAVVHGGTASALDTLQHLHAEHGRRVFLAGSWAYTGVPLLESAVRSVVAIMERLGHSPAWMPR